MSATRSPITTHVLDVGRGRAAAGIAVHLERRSPEGWISLKRAATNADGRVEDLLERGSRADAGTYRLTFDIHAYFEGETFYPEAAIVFEVRDPAEHHHVPLLVSAYGYSTYRGT